MEKASGDYSPGEMFYTRKVAEQYEAIRQNDRYWSWENGALNHCLDLYCTAGRIADCPVGTGRFMEIYSQRDLPVLGIDLSQAMLDEAEKKAEAIEHMHQVELIQGDVSSLTLDHPVARALVCFRLLHLISDKRLDEVIKGIATIPSEYIFLQIFSVRDFNIRRVAGRVTHAMLSKEIRVLGKLKYGYRTLRALIGALSAPSEAPSTYHHEKNTFCNVTYSHCLPRILECFAQHGFSKRDSIELRDNAHLTCESGCHVSMVMVMHKGWPVED